MSWTASTEKQAQQARGRAIQAEVARMVSILSREPSVEMVVLHGSAAKGTTGIASDIDLLIVQNTTLRFLDRLGQLLELLEPRIATDLLVYTPSELEEMAGRSFVDSILRTGKVLYEKAR